MTEQVWLECANPQAMVDYLRCKVSERKLRLFAVACVRRLLSITPHQDCRTAVRLAEEFADGRITLEELKNAHAGLKHAMKNAWCAASRVERDGNAYFARKQDALWSDLPNVAQAITKEECDEVFAKDTIDAIGCVVGHLAILPDEWGTCVGDDAFMRATESERPLQCNLLRDVIGNPFCIVSVDAPWLAWHDGTVPKIAQTIYDERRWQDMPILADALEEAGCADTDILKHCRQPAEHVRGCWIVDLILGKQ